MRFTIEINDTDFEYCNSEADFANMILESVKDTITDIVCTRITSEYKNAIKNNVESNIKDILKTDKQCIIDKVTETISNKVLEQKQIKDQMPKKSELNAINKEWSDYFTDLINKAIEKRFKQMWGYK